MQCDEKARAIPELARLASIRWSGENLSGESPMTEYYTTRDALSAVHTMRQAAAEMHQRHRIDRRGYVDVGLYLGR